MADPKQYETKLAPTTSAANSDEFSPAQNNTTLVLVSGLQGSETATLQVYNPLSLNADKFDDCPDDVIKATTNPYLNGFLQAGTYRIKKSATVNPVGVSIVQNINTATVKLGG